MKKPPHIPYYIVLIAFVLVFLITWLHPALSARLYPFKRQIVLNSLLTKLEKEKNIDPQIFWKFREQYYPGSLVVDKNGVKGKTYFTVTKDIHPLLYTVFESKYITSYEYLVSTNDLNYMVPFNEDYKMYLNSGVAYRDHKEYVELVFVKPISEMVKANGFLDYKDKDKKLLEDRYWMVMTEIRR